MQSEWLSATYAMGELLHQGPDLANQRNGLHNESTPIRNTAIALTRVKARGFGILVKLV